jgi:hypothetical protein
MISFLDKSVIFIDNQCCELVNPVVSAHPQPADPNPDLRTDFRNSHFKVIHIVCTGITYGTVRYVPVLFFLRKADIKTLKALLQPYYLPYTSVFFYGHYFENFLYFVRYGTVHAAGHR